MKLLAPLTIELNALNRGIEGVPGADQRVFGRILASLLSDVAEGQGETAGGAGVSDSLATLAKMFSIPGGMSTLSNGTSSLLTESMAPLMEPDFSKLLQLFALRNESSTQTDGLDGAEQRQAVGETGEPEQTQDIGKLLLGMLSDLVRRLNSKTIEAGQNGPADLQPRQESSEDEATAQSEDGMPSEPESAKDLRYVGRDEKILRSLALLFFSVIPATETNRQEGHDEITGEAVSGSDVWPERENEKETVEHKQATAGAGIQTSWQSGPIAADLITQAMIFPAKGALDVAVTFGRDDTAKKAGKESMLERSDKRAEQSSGLREDQAHEIAYLKANAIDFTKEITERLGLIGDRSSDDLGLGQLESAISDSNSSNDTDGPSLFILKGTIKNAAQNMAPQGVPFKTVESGDETASLNGRTPTDSADGVLSKVIAVVGEEHENSSGRADAGGERGQPDSNHQRFMAIDQPPTDRLTTGQKTVGSGNPGFSAMIDRFEKIARQTALSNSHDLVVKLDVGNQETVVVGLKDLGQTIAVEVRASHQGLVNLLESQKETIMRHLEDRAVRTAIFVDPNASGNPDRKDRRETRERGFRSAPTSDRAFGHVLEIVA